MQRFYRRSIVVRPLMTVMLALLFSACSSSEDPGRFNTDLAECRESAVEASGWEPDAPLARALACHRYRWRGPKRFDRGKPLPASLCEVHA